MRADGIVNLNNAQQQAAIHNHGPMLVLAGAGSGKTRVVTERLARLIREGVSPSTILAVTFTNKAADEMRERVAKLVGKETAKQILIGTFHSFGARFLRKEIQHLGYPSAFTIFDTADQMALIQQAMVDVGATSSRHDPREILNRIGLAKAACIPPEEMKESGDPDATVASKVAPRYARMLKAMGAVDFEDLIALPVMILQRFPQIHAAWSSRFHYVLVDEYQDTNKGQFELIRQLCGKNGNLFVVGDDDQSIYAWRGADHTNILRFQEHFPTAQVVFLTQNYRSTGPILKAANAVIKKNEERMDKELWTEAEHGEPLRIVHCESEDDQAAYVVDDIQRRLLEEGRRYGHFGILYRTNSQARPLEEHLRACNLPYQVVGGTKFFDRKEVKDLVAYLRLLINPRDEISLRRIINTPPRGIGESTVEALLAHAASRRVDFWSACRDASAVDGLAAKSLEAVNQFVGLLNRIRSLLRTNGPSAAVGTLIQESRFLEHLNKSERSEGAALRRVEHIRALLTALTRHEQSASDSSLESFITKVSLDNRGDETDDLDPNVITLMTLHGAKGLEFPVVYLVGMEEGLLPHRRRVGSSLTPIYEPELSEERRLCYVGLTRARECLTMTLATKRRFRNQTIRTTPSRFLRDIPLDVFQAGKREQVLPASGGGSAQKLRETLQDDFFGKIKDLF